MATSIEQLRAARRGRPALAAVGLALVLVSAACARTASSADASSADKRETGVPYAQCMRANGVADFPDPDANGRFALTHGEGGINQDDPKFRAASEKCRALAPGGEHRDTSGPAQVQQMRAYSQCMRDHGLPDFPDPDANGQLRGLGHEAQGDPKYRAAQEACTKFLPGGGAH